MPVPARMLRSKRRGAARTPPKGASAARTPPKGASVRTVRVASRADVVVAALRAQLQNIRARYDAAQTLNENRKHWAMADSLSANAANSSSVRKLLRERARYEVANNSYAQGMLLTLANDTIGTGPRLQLLTENEADNDRVENLFAAWTRRIKLAPKLRTMRLAKAQDGEAFALIVDDPGVKFFPSRDGFALAEGVGINLRLIECDRVSTAGGQAIDQPVDGVILDEMGSPTVFHVLRQHPGDPTFAATWEHDEYPANAVLHYFAALRPEQVRGIPEIMSALPLFSQLRRYTLAVVTAAEVAADHAAVIESNGTPNEQPSDVPEAMDTIELERGLATFLPEGWKLGQMKSEQPSTTYPEAKREFINEIARCLSMPFNVAAGNSSGYNYASGRLDHQVYYRSLGIEQSEIEASILDPLFSAWMNEAVLIEGYLPQSFRMRGAIPHQWFWDGNEHVDPQKEASAQETRLRNGTTTLAEEYGRRGRDWRVEGKQRLQEEIARLEAKAFIMKRAQELATELGVPVESLIDQPGATKSSAQPAAQTIPEDPADA